MNKFAEGCDLENINQFFNTAGGNNVIVDIEFQNT